MHPAGPKVRSRSLLRGVRALAVRAIGIALSYPEGFTSVQIAWHSSGSYRSREPTACMRYMKPCLQPNEDLENESEQDLSRRWGSPFTRMKTRLPEVNPILHGCGDGSALACIPIRTGVKTSVFMIDARSSFDRGGACTTLHADRREGAPRLPSTEDMSSSRRRSNRRS